MKNTIISDFEGWFKSNERRWRDRDERAVFDSVGWKAGVGITCKFCLADITVWDAGACDTIALSTVTCKEIWVETYNFQDFKEVAENLEGFIDFVTAYNSATQT